MKSVYIITGSLYGIDLSQVHEGGEYVLSEHVNENTGETVYKLNRNNGSGIPGNMDSSIKRYHGWRGTTNNVRVEALGLRRVEKVYYVHGEHYDDCQTAKVKLSADLLPDVP